MRGQIIEPEKIKQAKGLKRQGVPYRQIANELGISLGAIAANTKEIIAPKRATHKYPREDDTEEVPTQQPKVIYPEYRRPFHFEGPFIETPRPQRQRTAEELQEHYEEQDRLGEELLHHHRQFLDLADKHQFKEAEEAYAKYKEAQRKFYAT